MTKQVFSMIIVLISLLTISCDMMIDANLTEKAEGHTLYETDFSGIDSYEDIAVWIEERVEYRSENTDEWLNPAETLARGYGDCDDFAILFINIAYFRFGVKGNLIAVDANQSRSIVSGGQVNHAIVEIQGSLYSPTGSFFVSFIMFARSSPRKPPIPRV